MKKLIPDMYCKSIYDIDYTKLKEKKIKCLLFDLDNTCVPYPIKKPTEELLKLFSKLESMDFKVIIFSNTPTKRLEYFKNKNIEARGFSKKPSKKNFILLMKQYFYQKKEVCIIGDQLFTDIYGGNKVGINTLLVEPLGNKDFIFTKIFRGIEKIVFKKMEKKQILTKGVYYYER